MMTSVVSGQARAPRDRALPTTTTHTPQPQKQIQATAEQIRLAQMIYDKNDADFEDKVKQLMEVAGKTQDECMVALHDCNEDVNRAINFLLESTSDTTCWETVGRKRVGKDGGPEVKEGREKRSDRDASRGRGGGGARRGRGGASRGREGEDRMARAAGRSEENGFEAGPGERGGGRGRGRGRGLAAAGRGRGRAAGGSRFSTQGMGTFNPADYSANAGASRQDTWDTEGQEGEGPGTWRGNLEDWAAEDWNEDLSETKVFTASAPVSLTTPGHNVDLSSLLPKAGGGVEAECEGAQGEGLGQSLVFTNSHHNGRTATHSYAHAASNTYAHAASAPAYAHTTLSSVLGSGFGGSGFGGLSGPKPLPSEVRIPEQLNGPRPLLPRTNQPLGSAAVAKETGPPAAQSSAPAPSSQAKENTHTSHLDLKQQPEPSAVLSQLSQRHQSALPPQPDPPLPPPALHRAPTPPGHHAGGPPPRDGPSPGAPPITEPPQRQMKTQRRRVPPPSKIPSSAVEMPGSADVSGLNVQFGALDFGSEPSVAEDPRDPPLPNPPAPQPQSLFSKPVSESLGSLPSVMPSDPSFPSPSLGLPSATAPPSMGLPSATAPPPSSAPAAPSRPESSGPRSLPPHLGYPPQGKDGPQGPLTNGYGGGRPQSTQDNTSVASLTPKPVSPPMTGDSGPAHHLPSPAHHIPSPAPTPAHSAPLPSLSSHVTSTHASVSALSASSALTMSSEDHSGGGLHGYSSSGVGVPGVNGSSNGMMHGGAGGGAPGLTANGPAPPLSSTGRSGPLLTSTSGKAPPNLAQGVPPLLANQYIMGPGGLLPAYPQIYGYEDLQMLQSRLPMDYYGVPFPGTTAMPGRDGLANNPYSGEATKFGRGDSSSPAPPPTSLSAGGGPPSQQQSQGGAQQSQGGGQQQSQQQQQQQQNQGQAFLNPPLPPGYGYTGLPYYTGVPGVPSAFQYGPTVFVPPAPPSAKQNAMAAMGNPAQSQYHQHQPSYSQHAYGTAFDDLSQGHAGDYSKAYGGSAQSQNKSAGSGPGKAPGLSGSANSGGVPDMGASMYSKTQSFDKQGFHTGTPPPFSLPSALGGNPGPAPGYGPAPFLHILPHQQHSQLLHHHMNPEAQAGPGQRSQSSSMQQKSQGNKSSYGSSPYWAN